ncbi:peptidylprolyl isomerase [Aquimarina sp. MMG016]|uniref:peptidylprolyl isomerase n=1 Tax=Aquimarina sp. MMG016 TaxID=2822690 RepID=UPI001B3A4277|nr:peptidylprolyl isomerase [Aquimarina sp. MMG016]MBQ4822627.1 peptidylprolyl isomerase [Aquimarina sp. MMG016]
MHRKSLLFLIVITFFSSINAQQQDVLLTIDDSPVYSKEFKRVYLKNIDLVKDESQKDIDEYLELFINYKLKLEEAKSQGLDKKESYLKELAGYKKQLSSGYLTDSDASEALVKEAYNRSLERVNASHILINVKPNASEKDTLAAYQKITEARNKIINGEDFKTVANLYSEDPSVKRNAGDLGWFSVFRMVYPFEDAAYKTKVGDISEPFRTQFGYHILKVNNKEKKLGEVTVAHIMVAINSERTEKGAEERVNEINQQLKQGVSFESLAKEYSDDRNTAINGGKINRFGQGALNSLEFEKNAFALKKPGELSEPVKTNYGWHIIKLLEKHPPKTFDEQKSNLTKQVKRDSRSKLVSKSFINSLRKKYKLERNIKAISYFKKTIPSTVLNENWNIPDTDNVKKNILTIGKQSYTYDDFAQFLKEKGGRGRSYSDTGIFVEEMYNDFESIRLLGYYEEHLEEDNEDFANVLAEYRDGLLLFDLMESKIWNAAKTDSIGLQKFYEEKKNNYVQEETYKVLKASSSDQKTVNKIKEFLLEGKTIDDIKKEINLNKKPSVIFSEEELVKGEDALPKGMLVKVGEIGVNQENNYNVLIQIKEILPSRIKSFDETKGKVINDFQEYLESNWLKQLREKYTVKVNKKIVKRIKKDISI